MKYYYETTTEMAGYKVPVLIDEGHTDIKHMIPSTFFPAVAPGVLDLPKSCKKDKVCPKASACGELRAKFEESQDDIELI